MSALVSRANLNRLVNTACVANVRYIVRNLCSVRSERLPVHYWLLKSMIRNASLRVRPCCVGCTSSASWNLRRMNSITYSPWRLRTSWTGVFSLSWLKRILNLTTKLEFSLEKDLSESVSSLLPARLSLSVRLPRSTSRRLRPRKLDALPVGTTRLSDLLIVWYYWGVSFK